MFTLNFKFFCTQNIILILKLRFTEACHVKILEIKVDCVKNPILGRVIDRCLLLSSIFYCSSSKTTKALAGTYIKEGTKNFVIFEE